MKIQLRVIASLFATTVLVGCGGGGVSSGVDGSKPAETVTDAEAQDVCEAAFEYQADQADSISKADVCKQLGAATNDPVLCEAFVAGCEATEDEDTGEEPSETTPCAGVTAAQVQGCTVTVGEIEACLTERIDAFVDGIKSAPACDELPVTAEGEPEAAESACDVVVADEECAAVLLLAGGF